MKPRRVFITALIFIALVSISKSLSQVADPAHSNGFKEADEYIEQCKSSLEREDSEKAVEYAEKAIELNDSCSQYYYWLGRAYGLKAQQAAIFGKIPNAKKCKNAWIKAVELDPENLDARIGLFNYYLQAPGIAGGGKEKARKEAEEIMNLDPVEGYVALAQIYESEGNYPEAEKEYIQATQVNPENKDPLFNLGYYYQRQEKCDQAEETFQNILNIDPNNKEAKEALNKIKDKRKNIRVIKK